jgi:hypothetical protein
MHRLRLYILTVVFTVIYNPVYSQSYTPKQIVLADRIESAALNAPEELAYIQTSKDIYETGEDLWFKVYLLDNQTLIPSLRSKTLYLQLLEKTNKKPAWEEKYEILNGFSNGSIPISGSLAEGEYLLTAYTQFSFYGDSTEFKAVKLVKIIKDIATQSEDTVNSEKTDQQKSGSRKDKVIQFNVFPEGGDLISGIRCKLAFKAVNRNGEPVEITGNLYENDIPVLSFASMHAGMGFIYFVPDQNKKYFIKLQKPAVDTAYYLPEILPEGMAMALVSGNAEYLSFKISQNAGQGRHDYYIRVQCRGVVYGMTSGRIKSEILIKIPLSLLPQGIAEVTLFNENLDPVAERLVYINQNKKLNITAELSDESFTQRGKGQLKIKVKDSEGNPLMANLGISVFDRIYQNQLDSGNILSHVYLSSQLKGRIYNPSYYFNSLSKERDPDLDLLLLTQGWRKYVWSEKNLRQSKEPANNIIFDGTSGMTFYPGRKKKIPKEQTFVMAFSPNKDTINVVIPSDSAGVFTVTPDLLQKWEDDYVYLKPFGSWGSRPKYNKITPEIPEYDLHIKLTDPFETINQHMKQNRITYPLYTIVKNKDENYTVPTADGVIEIEGVTIKGHREKTIRGKYMRTLDSLTKYDLYHDYVCEYGYLNCPYHTRDDYGSTKPIPGNWYNQILGAGTPAIRVVRVPYLPPNFSEEQLLGMSNLSRVKSYVKVREFYKPDYDKKNGDELIPDFRNTLLWEPSVFTDMKGEVTLSFYCSDINSTFTGRIEGVGGDGLLGAAYFNFNVRKVKIAPK